MSPDAHSIGARPARPRDVDTGVKLAYVSLLWGIISDVLDFGHFWALDNVATLVFTYGLLILLIMKVASGQNWARTVLLIVFVAGLGLFVLMFFVGVYPTHLPNAWKRHPAMILVDCVPTALQSAALFFWFKSTCSAWFKVAISSNQ